MTNLLLKVTPFMMVVGIGTIIPGIPFWYGYHIGSDLRQRPVNIPPIDGKQPDPDPFPLSTVKLKNIPIPGFRRNGIGGAWASTNVHPIGSDSYVFRLGKDRHGRHHKKHRKDHRLSQSFEVHFFFHANLPENRRTGQFIGLKETEWKPGASAISFRNERSHENGEFQLCLCLQKTKKPCNNEFDPYRATRRDSLRAGAEGARLNMKAETLRQKDWGSDVSWRVPSHRLGHRRGKPLKKG
jgi:hypothetical protein